MNAAGPGGGQADAKPAGIFGISAGHEGGGFLVPHPCKATNLLLALPQRLHDAVNTIARETEYDNHAPVFQYSAKMSPPVLAMIASFTFE